MSTMRLYPPGTDDIAAHHDVDRPVLDIQKAAMAGGEVTNPIFTGALGMYNNCVIRERTGHQRCICHLCAATAARRAVSGL